MPPNPLFKQLKSKKASWMQLIEEGFNSSGYKTKGCSENFELSGESGCNPAKALFQASHNQATIKVFHSSVSGQQNDASASTHQEMIQFVQDTIRNCSGIKLGLSFTIIGKECSMFILFYEKHIMYVAITTDESPISGRRKNTLRMEIMQPTSCSMPDFDQIMFSQHSAIFPSSIELWDIIANNVSYANQFMYKNELEQVLNSFRRGSDVVLHLHDNSIQTRSICYSCRKFM